MTCSQRCYLLRKDHCRRQRIREKVEAQAVTLAQEKVRKLKLPIGNYCGICEWSAPSHSELKAHTAEIHGRKLAGRA